MTFFPTMSEQWSQKELSQVVLDERSQTGDHSDGADAPETQTGQMEAQSGETPEAVSTAAVALVPKGANQTPTPLDLRPITVTRLLYNLWAGTLFVDVLVCGVGLARQPDVPLQWSEAQEVHSAPFQRGR